MKNPAEYLNWITEKMYKTYSNDGGKLLVHMGAASWIFGAIAQIGNLLGNKNIDKKQKKFLLPQEAADAAVNITLYYTICEAIKGLGDHLVENGKLLTDDVARLITKIAPSKYPIQNINNWSKIFKPGELKSKLTDILKDAKNLKIIKNAPIEEQAKMIEAAESALKALEKHKNNVGIITSITASILASNILTPIARNSIAAKMQKRLQHKEDIETRKTQIKENITMKNLLPTSFKSFNNYNSFSGIKI